jgi:hypothetical protein
VWKREAGVHKEPLSDRFKGKFREFDGQLFIRVCLGENPKSSKQIQFII